MLVLPRTVDIRWPKAEMTMRIDLGVVEINRLSANTADLWNMPSYEGWPPVDLCNPNLPSPSPQPPVTTQRGWRQAGLD